MKIELLEDLPHEDGSTIVKGSTIEHKDCWFHVLRGVAKPADEECAKRVAEWRRTPKPAAGVIITPPKGAVK